MKLRNDILSKIQIDLLPSNRLQLEGSDQDFSGFMGRSKDMAASIDDHVNSIFVSLSSLYFNQVFSVVLAGEQSKCGWCNS